jgi:hypothetical protein
VKSELSQGPAPVSPVAKCVVDSSAGVKLYATGLIVMRILLEKERPKPLHSG